MTRKPMTRAEKAVLAAARKIHEAATSYPGFPVKRQRFKEKNGRAIPTKTEYKNGYSWANEIVAAYARLAKERAKGK